MALLVSYQKHAFACSVEVPYDAYSHIGIGVTATWGLIALDAIVAGTTITAAAFTIGIAITAAAIIAVPVLFAIQNRDCLMARITNF